MKFAQIVLLLAQPQIVQSAKVLTPPSAWYATKAMFCKEQTVHYQQLMKLALTMCKPPQQTKSYLVRLN